MINYSDLGETTRRKHQKTLSNAHIRRQYIAAAGKKLATDMDCWAGWFLLAVVRGREQQVQDLLIANDIDAWLPRMVEEVPSLRRGGVRRPRLERRQVIVFPGFLLVRIVPSAQAWHGLAGFDHVLGLVAQGCAHWDHLGPEEMLRSAVDDRFIGRIRTMEECETVILSTGALRFQAGTRVRVRNGPFLGVSGIVSARKAAFGTVWVEVDTFGRKTRILFALDDIEKSNY